MRQPKQLSLFVDNRQDQIDQTYSGRDLGTFKDSLRAPIYRWFRYPAGYSYKFVQESIDLFAVQSEDWIYDPFSGTGTTLICAKQNGVNAYGVEAHSFVHWVASVKLNWNFEVPSLRREIEHELERIEVYIIENFPLVTVEGVFPELVYKCYHPIDLKVLYLIREYLSNLISNQPIQNLLKLALTDSLRTASVAGTGWPYIAPPDDVLSKQPQNALRVFQETARQMYLDLESVDEVRDCQILNVLGDSRQTQDLTNEQVALALTSPPYLNNYDYADRTRLETYFWGLAQSWSDITERFRDKLIVAATTQVTRSEHDIETALSKEIEAASPHAYETIQQSVLKLAKKRLEKGGKKDYDLMTALYFNDMWLVLQETYRILKKYGHFCLVLGDSAPYGVHIPTDTLIGELALGVGFSRYDYYELRERGGKWKENPQRHKVPLREGIIVLTK